MADKKNKKALQRAEGAAKKAPAGSSDAKEKRKIIIKAIAAGVAFIIAMASFTIYAKQCTKREEGWYVVDPNPNDFAPYYYAGTELNYYFGGESNDIHTAMNAVRLKYSEALSHIYRLLDAENSYEGYVNLHYINTHPGEGIELDPLLFGILKDAMALTEEGGFDLFGGVLYHEWESVTVLAEPEEQDPLVNEEEQQRISRIAAMNADRSNFSLEITDESHCIVRFTVSEAYRSMLDELEVDYPVLDLGALKRAYELDYAASELEKEGWTQGFIVTKGGLTRALSGADGGVYLLYSLNGSNPAQACRLPMTGGSACASLRAFPLEEDELQYYTVQLGSGEVLRHPNTDPVTGEMGSALLSSCVVDKAGSLARAWVAANRLISAEPEEVRSLAKAAASNDTAVVYITAADPLTVNVDSAHAGVLTLSPSGDFTAAEY